MFHMSNSFASCFYILSFEQQYYLNYSRHQNKIIYSLILTQFLFVLFRCAYNYKQYLQLRDNCGKVVIAVTVVFSDLFAVN